MKICRLRHGVLALATTTALLLPGCETMKGFTPYEDEHVVETHPIFPTVGLRRAPPLHERGIRRLGVIYKPMDRFELLTLGSSSDDLERDQVNAQPLIPPGYVEELFLRRINSSPHITGRLLGQSQLRLPGRATHRLDTIPEFTGANGPTNLEQLRADGIDAVLLVREISLPDRFFGVADPPYTEPEAQECEIEDGGDVLACAVIWTLVEPAMNALVELPGYKDLGAKGVFNRHFTDRVRAFAGFEASLIDPATGQELKNGSYVQASAEPIKGLAWKQTFDSYTLDEQRIIVEAVKKRIANNVRQVLLMMKVLPLRGDEYVIFNPERDLPPPPYKEGPRNVPPLGD